MEECWICGDVLHNGKYVQELKCGHKFHYECILKTFEMDKDISNGKKKYLNYCPYCSKEIGLLEIVNGLTNIKKGIHYGIKEKKPIYMNEKCISILKSGKNKGERCNRKCILGYKTCGNHKI